MRRIPVLLALAALLAGCLEEPPAPAGGQGLPTLPTAATVPTLRPPLPGEPETVYARDHAFDGPRRDAVAVPSDADVLLFDVGMSAALNGTPRVSVALLAPNGTVAAECADGACSARVDAPPAGAWAVAYAGVAPRNASVKVRLLFEVQPPTFTPVTPTTPTMPTVQPVPTPSTVRARLYLRGYDWGQEPGADRTEDTFVVFGGLHSLHAEARWRDASAPGDALVEFLDPAGLSRATCVPAPGSCTLTVPSPKEGLWRVAYGGSGRVQADVEVTGFSSASPYPSNASVYRATHAYPSEHPWNRTAGFWVHEGYPSLLFGVSFRHEGLSREGDTPRVLLYDPQGALRARCEIGPGLSCPSQVHAEPGLWRLWYLGPATGSAEVQAFLYGGPPGARPEPTYSTLPEPGETMLHRNVRESAGERAPVPVPADVGRLRFVVEANGTLGGRVDLVGPDGVTWATCAAPCQRILHLNAGQEGEWWVVHGPGVPGGATASVYGTRR